jgi:small subunit ribosomal protein S6
VLDGTLPDEVIQKEQKQIEDFFKANAQFEKTDVWGKRALAYVMNKKRSGVYVHFQYSGEGNVPAAFEKHIKLNENLLRHLTVVRNVKNDAAREALAARRERPEVPKPEEKEADEDQE